MWLTVAAAGAALLVTEKLPALVALAPLLLVAAVRASWRGRALAAAVGAVVLSASLAPYLFYSDGQSWSAYGGDRYYAIATTPWSGGTEEDLTPWQTRDSLSPGFVLDQVTDPSDDLPAATLTYAIGRHTGVLTFQPIAALLLVAAAGAGIATTLRRRRPTPDRAGLRGRSQAWKASDDRVSVGEPAHMPPPRAAGELGARPDASLAGEVAEEQHAADRLPSREGDPRRVGVESASNRLRADRLWGSPRGVGVATSVGLAAYVALYLVVFTDNYFGGGQSIGNRYFLQVSPLIAAVAVSSPLTARVARWCAAGAAAWALIVLHPLLRSPEEAFFHLERTSSVQDLLPFDGSQKHSWRFSCEPAECVPPPLEAFDS
jgi:hypothetical protein